MLFAATNPSVIGYAIKQEVSKTDWWQENKGKTGGLILQNSICLVHMSIPTKS